MADTDQIEWRLLSTNLTTVLGILPATGSHLYLQLNEPGSGELKIPYASAIAASVTSGCFAQAYYRGALRGGFFCENIEKIFANGEEGGGQLLSISGRGPLALLDDAIMFDDGSGATSRTFTALTKAHILILLILEAQARGALANLTYDFSATVDSSSVSWTDSETITFNVGISLLDVTRQFADLGIDFDIVPSGSSFILKAYKNGKGSDLSSTIYFRTGVNCTDIANSEVGTGIKNLLRVKYGDGYTTVKDATSISSYRRRESLLDASYAGNVSSALTFGEAELDTVKDPATSITVNMYDGVKPYVFADYTLGDSVRLDKSGSEETRRIHGINLSWSNDALASVTVDLNSTALENSIRMAREIERLKDIFTTAKDADLAQVAYWDYFGINVNTDTIDAIKISGTKMYIGGNFTSIAGIAAASCAVYDFTTKTWSAIATSLLRSNGSQGTVLAIEVVGSTVYFGGQFLSVNGTNCWCIFSWNGSTASAMAGGIGDHTTGLLSNNVYALCGIGTNLYIGGSFSTAFSTSNTLCIAKWSGSAYSALGTGTDGGEVDALATDGTNLYAGGTFHLMGGVSNTRLIAKYVFGSSSWTALGAGMGGWNLGTNARWVQALLYLNGYIYVGGNFTDGNGVADTANITRWSVAGAAFDSIATTDSFAAPDSGGGIPGNKVMALATDGIVLYVGGFFTEIDDVAMKNIGVYNGGSWAALLGGVGAPNQVYALGFYALNLYAGGQFYTVDGKTIYNFAIYINDFESLLDHFSDGGRFGYNLGAGIHAAPAKTTASDSDEFPLWNSVTGLLAKITWANIKATLKTYFDTLYVSVTQTASRVLISSSGGTVTTDSALGFDTSNKQLNIGLTSPFSTGPGIQDVSEGASVVHLMLTIGSGFASRFRAAFARGTLASPTAVQANDVTGRFSASAHDGVGYELSSNEIRMLADENHSGSAHGGRIEVHTTPNGSTTLTLAATFESDQTLNMEGHKIQGVADPTSAQHAATKAYVDSVATGGSIPIVTSDPVSPNDGEMWLLRETIAAIPDGTPIGLALALTYTGNASIDSPLVLSVWDDSLADTGRINFTYD